MEQRRSKRIRLDQPASLEHGANVLSGRTENISRHGAMLHLPELGEVGAALRPGVRVVVTFRLPGIVDALRLNAIVRWRSSVLTDTIGVEFSETLPDDADRLLRLLEPG